MDNAVEQLKADICTKVLRKSDLGEDDTVTINGTEFGCNMLDRLRHGEKLNAWLLLACAKISDKPSFVRYGYSVPLQEPFGKRNGIRDIPRPFESWRKNVDSWSKANKVHGTAVPLVYFCPLTRSSNHFTLLEINERDEKIYHYDSGADEDVIGGTRKSTRMRKLVQVRETSMNKRNLKTNLVRRSLVT